MKAAVYDVEGAPGVLQYVDVPDPVAGPDDVMISVDAISIEGGRSDQSPLNSAASSFMDRWLCGRRGSCCRRIESP